MRTFGGILAVSALIAGSAQAGSITLQQFQIGGTNGLTSSYVGTGAGSWTLKSYQTSIFNNSTITSQSQTLPNLGSSNATAASITDSEVTDANNASVVFNMIASGSNKNIWASTNANLTTPQVESITIPIGIFDADQAWIMLNDFYGYAGSDPTVTFNFASGGSVAVLLTDGSQIRSSVDCTFATNGSSGPVPCPAVTLSGVGTNSGANAGHTVLAGNPYTTSTTPTTINGISVSNSTVWSANYASPNGNDPYNCGTAQTCNGPGTTSGKLMLDAINFNWASNSALANDELLSITITSSSNNILNASQLALSAITVEGNSLATPEPASLWFAALGIGVLGFFQRRTKKAV